LVRGLPFRKPDRNQHQHGLLGTQRHSGLGHRYHEAEVLLEIELDGVGVVTVVADREVLARLESEIATPGVDLDSMSERELERLYAGLLKLEALPHEELRALVASLLAETLDD
jgi:hypothetical protein